MSGVFRIIDPPPLTARRVCTPPPLVRGEDTLAGWRGGGGSIVRKTPDTALYSLGICALPVLKAYGTHCAGDSRIIGHKSRFVLL